MTAQLTVDDAIRLGAEHFQAGRLADAERFFRLIFTVDPGHPVANHALGLIALAIGRHDDAAGLIGTALQRMPEEPGFLNSLGEVHRISQRYLAALACYERAISLDPAYAEALSNRAITLHALGRNDDALASCDAALAAKPQLAAAWSNRGVILETSGRVDEALASFDKALEILPGFVDATGNRGSILQRLLRIEEALASYREALKLNPEFVIAHVQEATCLLLTGKYTEGWMKYEYRSKAHASLARDFKQPAWRGDQDIAGKTVLLHAEQDIGDTLHFARYVRMVASKKARVILEVQPPLKPLLRGIGATRVIARGEELPEFDLHCALPSLPLAFGTTLETIPSKVPYLSIEKQAVTAWRRKLARKGTKLVGLCWKGDPVYRNERDRSIGLADLQPVLDLPGLRFLSLQEDLSEEERALVGDRDNFGHAGASFKDTAEMVAALDLVITVDTAWAHWAGAIGKPVWVMLAHYPHWCWLLERQDSPWYPTARLFRQTQAGEWGPVLAQVRRGLAAFGRKV